MAKLDEYRRKRHAGATPEPVPPAGRDQIEPVPATGEGTSFVIHEHHATALHWDLRLEHEGVLASWAVPKGIPDDPRRNHLAVHVEDHPLEYATFKGNIGEGQYGAGQVTIWDAGTYELEKWTDREVKFVLHGHRVEGRFALFQTGGKNWMIHRMDAPSKPNWEPLPTAPKPMLATLGELPPKDDGWTYEMKWDGVRALVAVEGGRITVWSRNSLDVTVSYPELHKLGEQIGSTQMMLDGEIVRFDQHGKPSFSLLQSRMHVSSASKARTLAAKEPVVLLLFDLLHLDGRSLLKIPYAQRRELLDSLELDGPNWQTPPTLDSSGADAVALSREQGLEGVMAKRSTSTYGYGRRSKDWVKIKNVLMQEIVIGGWKPGQGRRTDTIGSLIMGIPDDTTGALRYVGHVGTGFSQSTLEDLLSRLKPLARRTSPFDPAVPAADARDAQWVTPKLVGEVGYGEWTRDDRLRHPRWHGLRPDKSPDEVRPERPG